METQTYLLTGGNGYIGSHTYVELYHYIKRNNFNRKILILDNFYNSDKDLNKNIQTILKVKLFDVFLFKLKSKVERYSKIIKKFLIPFSNLKKR